MGNMASVAGRRPGRSGVMPPKVRGALNQGAAAKIGKPQSGPAIAAGAIFSPCGKKSSGLCRSGGARRSWSSSIRASAGRGGEVAAVALF